MGVWNGLFQESIRRGAKITVADVLTLDTSVRGTPPSEVPTDLSIKRDAIAIKDKKEAPQNGEFLTNGHFNITNEGELFGWGEGFYSSKFKQAYPSTHGFWMNFLNADIDVSVIDSDKGKALKIAHKSKTQDHSVGLMEQLITVAPGVYRLSFWAKADSDFEEGAIQFFTTNDWRVTDLKGIRRGFEIPQKGPFEWQQFSTEDIHIDTKDSITFSVVSAKRGTVLISNVSLVKVNG